MTPKPVEALPCGSRSTTRTDLAAWAASAVARLTAVVVLPTPPFWLATAMIRGVGDGDGSGSAKVVSLDSDDGGGRVGEARTRGQPAGPARAERRDFLFRPLPLRKEADGPGVAEGCRQVEKRPERREGARGHDIDREAGAGDGLDPHVMDRGDARRFAAGLAQKLGLAHVALDQMHGQFRAGDGQDQAGEAGAGAEIDQGTRSRWNILPQL